MTWLVLLLLTAPPVPVNQVAPIDRAECQVRASDTYFFPKGWVGESTDRFDQDQFSRRWYSKALNAMSEPSLSCRELSDDVAFRFLWLRTWGRPIAVRIQRSTGGGARISGVELDGAGGYEPGKVSRRFQRTLTDAEWIKIADAVQGLHFWELPTSVEDNGLDGAQWVLEGRRGSQYHVVSRWSPKDGSFREYCLSLLTIIDWLPAGKGKSDAIY